MSRHRPPRSRCSAPSSVAYRNFSKYQSMLRIAPTRRSIHTRGTRAALGARDVHGATPAIVAARADPSRDSRPGWGSTTRIFGNSYAVGFSEGDARAANSRCGRTGARGPRTPASRICYRICYRTEVTWGGLGSPEGARLRPYTPHITPMRSAVNRRVVGSSPTRGASTIVRNFRHYPFEEFPPWRNGGM